MNTELEEKYTNIASIEWSYESYEFNLTDIFVRKSDGALFSASDSGCSCPAPFEDTTEADLAPIKTMQDFRALVREQGNLCDYSRADVNRAKTEVSAALTSWTKGK